MDEKLGNDICTRLSVIETKLDMAHERMASTLEDHEERLRSGEKTLGRLFGAGSLIGNLLTLWMSWLSFFRE